MADGYDEQTEADQLDAVITSVLAGQPGRGADPTVLWLAAAARVEPPASLHRRIARRLERQEVRRWRPTQLVAAVLASVLISNGLGNIWNHNWVAENIGEAASPHAFIEGGLALLAVAVVVSIAVFSYRALPYAVASATPLGLAYGVRGFGEIGEFTAGAVLHIGQGVLALALLVLWWRARRYGSAGADEGEV
jgi:hypothetical protein